MPQLNPLDWGPQLIWLLITFSILYLLMKRVALPRIGSVLEARAARISGDLETAEKLRRDTQEAIAAYEQALAEAKKRAHAIADQGREKLKAEMAEERAKLERELAEKAAEAEKRIEQARARMDSLIKQTRQKGFTVEAETVRLDSISTRLQEIFDGVSMLAFGTVLSQNEMAQIYESRREALAAAQA